MGFFRLLCCVAVGRTERMVVFVLLTAWNSPCARSAQPPRRLYGPVPPRYSYHKNKVFQSLHCDRPSLTVPMKHFERRLAEVVKRITSTGTAKLGRRNRDKFRVALLRRPSGLHGDFASTRPIPETVLLENREIPRAPDVRYQYTHSE